jgi:hypothetical protein
LSSPEKEGEAGYLTNSEQTKPAGEGEFGSSPQRTSNEQRLQQWLKFRMLHQRIREGQFPV